VRITIEMPGGKLIFSVLPYLARQLSVRKVVLTLTSASDEIYLSMAGAKQHDDTGFILVPAVGRTSSRGTLKALYCVAPRCLQRGLQAWRERRRSLQVPEV
jgi:hypothetical protein